jgi:uncharacterized protein YndB with AHSA1/START domain
MEQLNTTSGAIAPLKKNLQVSLPVEAAFSLFTDGMTTWWPLKSHSVGEHRAEKCVFEGHLGGRIYEVIVGGKEVDWGRVTAWDPPHEVSFTWFPGREADTGQLVEITFKAAGSGTQIDLMHSGWELLGERAQDLRRDYDTGWDYVLGQYEQRAAV